MEELIKSKERVQQHGEVFTPAWMVELMLNVPGVLEATESIDATFLEPAAGDGNFLLALLQRKLAVVENQYLENPERCKLESLWALASLYGIEFLEDNHRRSQERMLGSYSAWWEKILGHSLEQQSDFFRSARFLIEKNVVRGDTLEQKHPITGAPIVFFEWKRTDDPSRVAYRQDRLDRTLNKGTSESFFYSEDSGQQRAIASTLFFDDFTSENTDLEGTIEITRVFDIEER